MIRLVRLSTTHILKYNNNNNKLIIICFNHTNKMGWLRHQRGGNTRSSAIAMIADRTACSILTLFIVIATSRPLNKKSVCCQSADPTITADLRPQSAVRTPVLHLQSHRSRHRHDRLCVIVDKRAVPFRLPAWVHRHLWRFSLCFLWCILWLNDTSYSNSVWRDK